MNYKKLAPHEFEALALKVRAIAARNTMRRLLRDRLGKDVQKATIAFIFGYASDEWPLTVTEVEYTDANGKKHVLADDEAAELDEQMSAELTGEATLLACGLGVEADTHTHWHDGEVELKFVESDEVVPDVFVIDTDD